MNCIMLFLIMILFFWSFFPLCAAIFCAGPRHRRISAAIGARAAGKPSLEHYSALSGKVLFKYFRLNL
jgi:hypothetical protein